jgi:hypothetical protein
LGVGDATCPFGGSRFTVGAVSASACNGAPGGSGGPGGGWSGDGGSPDKVFFAGYTTATFTGNLGGRTGANASCQAQFAGSHFCTDWEYDQAAPPGPVPAGSVWIDDGQQNPDNRFYREYGNQLGTCLNWTTNLANTTFGGSQVRGMAVNGQGEFVSTFVAAANGGCQVSRALPCCRGGTSVRFRGFTPTTHAGNLGGRAGANALCHANFAGSHFCADWEYDQAGSPGPVPAGSAWIDDGNSATATRFYREYGNQLGTCLNWTTDLANTTFGGSQVRGMAINGLGEFVSTFVAAGNGGCQVARAVPCCD